MKHLRMAISATAVLVLLISGCSDQSLSPVSMNSGINDGRSVSEAGSNSDKIHRLASIKPHQSYEFYFENTGFYTINAISVLNCGDVKGHIDISGYGDDQAILLGCNSSGFSVWSIVILNTSDQSVDLDVFLTGSRTKVKNPDRRFNEF